jgi:hypothetical protein
MRTLSYKWQANDAEHELQLVPVMGTAGKPFELPKNLQGWYDGHTTTTIKLPSGWQYRSPAFTLFDL